MAFAVLGVPWSLLGHVVSFLCPPLWRLFPRSLARPPCFPFQHWVSGKLACKAGNSQVLKRGEIRSKDSSFGHSDGEHLDCLHSQVVFKSYFGILSPLSTKVYQCCWSGLPHFANPPSAKGGGSNARHHGRSESPGARLSQV